MTVTIIESIAIDAPAARAWPIVADQGRDTEWRGSVRVMTTEPGGIPVVGTTFHEVIEVAGKTYVNDGDIVAVVPGERIEWRTTAGAEAWGSRTVVPLGPDRCEVRLELHVVPAGVNRVLAPVLRRMMVRDIRADLVRLAALVGSSATAPA